MPHDDPYADRRRLTFEQAEGVEPLPAQLLPKELSQELRALLWALVYEGLRQDLRYGDVAGSWRSILYAYHVTREHLPVDEFIDDFQYLTNKLKVMFMRSDYVRIFGFLQYVIRHESQPHNFDGDLDFLLEKGRAGYRVLARKIHRRLAGMVHLADLV